MRKLNSHILFWLVAGLITLSPVFLSGQQSNTFYLMHEVPQSNLLNPAVQIQCNWYVGIPGLASSHISYANTAFTYRDLAGSENWNLYGINEQMHRVDLYGAETILNPLSIGYRHQSYYFNFNMAEKVHLLQTVPGDLVDIVLNGNEPFVGETARFDALRSAASWYREYSLGVSRVLGPYWTVGIHAKLLFGKANLHTGRSRLRFFTGEQSFDLMMEGDYELSSSFPLNITEDGNGNITDITIDEIDYARLLLNRRNPGLAFDLGVIYRYDQRITLSASLLDIGSIRWRTDVNNINGTGTFAFTGVEPGTNIVTNSFVNDMVDSLLNTWDVSTTRLPYFSFTPAQLYLGGTYHLKDHITVGFVNRNMILRSKLHSSVTLVAQARVAERFLPTVSWSYLNNSIKNIGMGVAYYGKGFQFHLVSDNVLGFFYPFDTRSVNLRIGMNLLFGCGRNRERAIEGETYGRMPGRGDCSWTGKQKNREKRLKKASRKQNRI